MKGLKSLFKKMMAILLTTMMIVSMMPVQVLAENIVIDPTTPPEERVIGDTNDMVTVATYNLTPEVVGDVDATIGNIDANVEGMLVLRRYLFGHLEVKIPYLRQP